MSADEYRFTDAQWRAYQNTPDQGYSHRAHLERLFNAWLAERDAKRDAAIRADQIERDARIAENMREVWPGFHMTERRGAFVVPPVREGGATDLFIKTTAASIRAQSPSPREVTDDGPWEYGGRPFTKAGEVWPVRSVEECEEQVAAHANPEHYVHEPHNSDMSPVVGYKKVRRRPASEWEPVPATTEGEKRA